MIVKKGQCRSVKYHHDDIVIHPRRGKGEKQLPAKGILLPNPTEAAYAIKTMKEKGGQKRPLFHSNLYVDTEQDFFVAGPSVGAPMAVICLEKLIALGARKIVLVSCCGCLEPQLRIGDIIVPHRAFSGEGTSTYYSQGEIAGPDGKLTENLEFFFTEAGMDFHRGAVWSTDAPFRESREELRKRYQEDAVAGVDMEFSALCAAASFRQISFGAVFVVSDMLLGTQWQAGFSTATFRKQSRTIIDHFILDRCHRFW